jgi:hypothetical protein
MSTARFLLPTVALATSALLPGQALAQTRELGAEVENSLVVDITSPTFDVVEDLARTLIPAQIPIPPVGAADENGCFFGACAYAYEISLEEAYVEVELTALDIVPGSNTLRLAADATVYVNHSYDPADLYVFAELFTADISNDTCSLYLNPIHLHFDAAILVNLGPDPQGADIDGDGTIDTKVLDVIVPPATWSWDADGNDFHFDDCGVADVINTINDVTGFFGFDLYEFLLDQVEPAIDDVVNGLPATIEPVIEDAFGSLTISQEIDLLGVPMQLSLWPSLVEMTPQTGPSPGGMRIGMSSAVNVPVADCVKGYGISGSASTPSAPPVLGTWPGLAFDPSVAAYVDDDFVNQVLFAAWSGGLLCYEISDASEELSLPIPINTGLLDLLAPGVYDGLFPETASLEIVTAPRTPPFADPAGAHDFDIVARDLGLGFIAELDGRKTRILEVSLDANVGLDLAFDPATGLLGVEVGLDGGAFVPTVTVNEFVPDSTATIETSFAGLFDTLVGPLLGPALEGLAFSIPSFEGLGITQLDVGTVGGRGDWTGLYAEVGEATYPSVGCEDGCDSSGCSSGCSQGRPSPAFVFVLPLLVAVRRRRL